MKKIKQLKKNECNRYELDEWTELRCGDSVELFIFDDDNADGRWVATTIEHDGNDYYAVGYKNLCLQGLWARVE